LREPVALDRTNIAFHCLYSWSRLFLSARWQSTTTGTSTGVALLFPMNDLFEAFVGRAMQSALAPGSTRLQHSGRHALIDRDQSLFALRPDIVVDNDTVIDTKWKSLIPDDPVIGVKQSDVYQMLAYANAYEARRVVMLYPWHPGLSAPGIYRRWNIAGTSIAFDIATVDVGQPDSVPTTLRDIISAPEPTEDSQLDRCWTGSGLEAD
jgi:5-methylcytosine-specific restriction enzyme subunit McrC